MSLWAEPIDAVPLRLEAPADEQPKGSHALLLLVRSDFTMFTAAINIGINVVTCIMMRCLQINGQHHGDARARQLLHVKAVLRLCALLCRHWPPGQRFQMVNSDFERHARAHAHASRSASAGSDWRTAHTGTAHYLLSVLAAFLSLRAVSDSPHDVGSTLHGSIDIR